MLTLPVYGLMKIRWIRRVSSQEQGSQFASRTILSHVSPNFKETSQHRQWSPSTPRYCQQCEICYRYETFLLQSISARGSHQSTFRTTVHEDNVGALSLANLEPGGSTPRSKHYAVKLHWFRSKLTSDGPHPIKVVQIVTDLQRADILTKGLTKIKFQAIRKLLCSW
jgi:hypothetical protein